jgi:uncharacterized membrane protein
MFSGSVGATVLRYAAMRHEARPELVAALLGIVRPLVPVVVGSMLLTILFGLWLASYESEELTEAWLIAAYILVGYILIIGAVAGKEDRLTRELAEKLSTAGSEKDQEDSLRTLRLRLRDTRVWSLNLSMLTAMIVVIALMVFRPK